MIKIINLKKINKKDGDLLKYLDKKNKYFKKFGETYFSKIKYKKFKGWFNHKKNKCFVTVPVGSVEIRFKLKSKIKKLIINDNSYKLLVIYPGTWYSFYSLSKNSLIVNTLDNIYEDNEVIKRKSLE